MSNTLEVVKVPTGTKGFSEDKDAAKKIRTEIIMPSLYENKTVVLDFSGVTSSTQSFVHALVHEPLQKFGEAALSKLEFRSCAPQIKSLVQLVVDYSFGGFSISPMEVAGVKKSPSAEPPQTSAPKLPPKAVRKRRKK